MTESGASMHSFDEATDELAWRIFRYSLNRVRLDPPPLDGPRSLEELESAVGETITAEGLGGTVALDLFTDELAPACISTDHQRFLSFIPAAPTEASVLFDMVVGASSLFAGSWLEGAGAVYAENQALRWLADLAGFPAEAGGVFVSGGTTGNLSALVAARHHARASRYAEPTRWAIVGADTTHSSIESAAQVMDVDVLRAPVDRDRRLVGSAVAAAIDSAAEGTEVFAVVATSGTTNLGLIDDLASIADHCLERSIWFHVDGAYGAAALAAPSVRLLFNGIERADSFIIDPHKWLFAPFDCAALIYRDPEIGRAAHTQHAEYLEPLTSRNEWNPSDYAHVLTRRARGLPLWFSLATHGTDSYRDAIEYTLGLAAQVADDIQASDHLDLVHDRVLSTVAFRRRGWATDDYKRWSDVLLASGQAFVTPTAVDDEAALRLCIISPRTTIEGLRAILSTL